MPAVTQNAGTRTDASRSSRGAGSRPAHPVGALAHAIDVLEALALGGEMGVSDISRQIGLSKTAVYNILVTFEGRRFVNRDPINSRYRLGWRLYELGTEVLKQNELLPLARPLLKELSRSTGETVLFGIIDRRGVTYIDRVESERAIRMVAAPGQQVLLHSTASGKLLLAHQPQDFIDEVLSSDLRQCTPQTITDPELLKVELRRVVKRGYAESLSENEPEICSISVPVRDHSGGIVAALTVAAPATRFAEPARRAALAMALKTASALSNLLGTPLSAAKVDE